MKRTCNGCKASTLLGGTLICELSFMHTVYRNNKGGLSGIPSVECPKPYSFAVLYEYAENNRIQLVSHKRETDFTSTGNATDYSCASATFTT